MSERAERIHFGNIKEGIEPPNLIEVQLNSYVDFLQKDVPSVKRKNSGLQAVFTEVFPIESYDGKASLDFSHYEIGEPKIDWLECRAKADLRRAASRHLPAQGREGHQGRESVHGRTAADDAAGHVRHQRRRARDRVASCIVRPVWRSKRRTIPTARCFSFRIIPDRGSWYEAQFDTSDLLYVYLDRKKRRRKFLTTTFFRASRLRHRRRESSNLFYDDRER